MNLVLYAVLLSTISSGCNSRSIPSPENADTSKGSRTTANRFKSGYFQIPKPHKRELQLHEILEYFKSAIEVNHYKPESGDIVRNKRALNSYNIVGENHYDANTQGESCAKYNLGSSVYHGPAYISGRVVNIGSLQIYQYSKDGQYEPVPLPGLNFYPMDKEYEPE